MLTLDLLPDHVLEAKATRERRAADALGLDAMRRHRCCLYITAILRARREGTERRVEALRVEVI